MGWKLMNRNRVSTMIMLHIAIAFSLLLGAIALNNLSSTTKIQEQNHIVAMLDWGIEGDTAALMSMDINGDQLHRIDYSTGTIAWSNDGKFLATGCMDSSYLCIYDATQFYTWKEYPPHYRMSMPKKIYLPEDCIEVNDYHGLNSISWSPDNQRLIIVCQKREVDSESSNLIEESNICLLEINGEGSQCWGKRTGNELFSRADWSPINDQIVIDNGKTSYILPGEDYLETGNIIVVRTGRVMEIVDTAGKVLFNLVDGWSPEWSPDGKEIAFFCWDDEGGYPGIASIHPDGTNFRWIYRSPQRRSGGDLEYYRPNFLDTFGGVWSSKISWSYDKKYLIVGAMYEATLYGIFKIEVTNGIITPISHNLSSYYQEPAVQP
jgi:WD40 repeat protein